MVGADRDLLEGGQGKDSSNRRSDGAGVDGLVLGVQGRHTRWDRERNGEQVLLFGAETWVLTKNMESALDAFQGRVARKLTGRHPIYRRDGDGFTRH